MITPQLALKPHIGQFGILVRFHDEADRKAAVEKATETAQRVPGVWGAPEVLGIRAMPCGPRKGPVYCPQCGNYGLVMMRKL